MTQSTKSPRKVAYEPAADGAGYMRIMKDPMIMHPSLINDPLAKWHNPDGEHVIIECYPDDKWLKRDIAAGHLVKVKKRKNQTTPSAAPGTEEK